MSGDKYSGLDVHRETIVVSVLSTAGREIERSILSTEAQSRLSFFEGLRGRLHGALEEGT